MCYKRLLQRGPKSSLISTLISAISMLKKFLPGKSIQLNLPTSLTLTQTQSKATGPRLWLWHIFSSKWFLQVSRTLGEYFKLASMIKLLLNHQHVESQWFWSDHTGQQGLFSSLSSQGPAHELWFLGLKKQNTPSSAWNWSISTFCSGTTLESCVYTCHHTPTDILLKSSQGTDITRSCQQ